MKTKIKVAAASATQASTASVSMLMAMARAMAGLIAIAGPMIIAAGVQPSIILHIALDLAARVFHHLSRDWRPGSRRKRQTMPPLPDNQYDQPEADGKGDERKRIGEPIEAAGGRSGQGLFAIFLHEGLQDGAIGFAARDTLVHFLELGFGHVARAGECGAGMAAGTGRIAAAAGAHELLADFARAVGGLHGSLREEGRDGEGRGEDKRGERKADFASRGKTP